MSTLAKALTAIRDSYPRQPFGDRVISAYAQALRDLSEPDVYDAVQDLIRTSPYPPTIADIRREVVERRLDLPTPEEAWDLALAGIIQQPDVRAAVNAVGGTWAIMHSDRPDTIRRQFRDYYTGRRQTIIRREQAGGSPLQASELELAISDPVSLNARRLAQLPASGRVRPRPIVMRWLSRTAGAPLHPPTEEEKGDAIRYLETATHDPEDQVYLEAFRVFEECGAPSAPGR